MNTYLFKLEVSVNGQSSTDYVISLADKLGKVEEEYLSNSHPDVQIHKIEIVSSCQILSSVKSSLKEELKKEAEFKHLTDQGATITVETKYDCWICSSCGWISPTAPCQSCNSTNGVPYLKESLTNEQSST